MVKSLFSKKNPEEFIFKKNVLNFLNAESIWHYKNNDLYRKSILQKQNCNFTDGKILSRVFKLKQNRGPSFLKNQLLSFSALSKKHFFIGNVTINEIHDLTNISKENIYVYNPPYVKGFSFSKKTISLIISKFRLFRPDVVWVGVGAPKQEILSNQLFNLYKTTYVNIGAGLDFLLNKKKEAPIIFRKLYLEWFYRLITDFKHSQKKSRRSIVGLIYIFKI